MFRNLTKPAKIGIIGSVVAIVAIVVYSVVIMISRIGKIEVSINVAPFSSVVKLNGENYGNNTKVYLEPGTYAVVAELEHFETFTKEFVISEESKQIYGMMDYTDDEGEMIYNQHLKDYLYVEGIYGALEDAAGEKLHAQYPILDYLPYNKAVFSLSYSMQEDGTPQINIKAEQVYLESAIEKLYSFNNQISIADYKVVVNDFGEEFDGASSDVADEGLSAEEFVRKKYGETIAEYSIKTKNFEGSYVGVVMSTTALEGEPYEYVYRTILKKEGSSWKMLATPYPILSRYNVPDVDSSVLDEINKTRN